MNKELLIVDDDLPFRERLSQSMAKKGFTVETFSSAHQVKAEESFGMRLAQQV